jgi:predicted transcriptional regulator
MKLPNGPGKHFSITLPEDTSDYLDRMAGRRGTYRGAIAREAILDWVSRQPPEPTASTGTDVGQEQGG